MTVNICGLPHEIIECRDDFNTDLHLGQIDYKELTIKVNESLPHPLKEETICHEMVHGILTHLGYQDLANDEQFVQALGNAIFQGFYIKSI